MSFEDFIANIFIENDIAYENKYISHKDIQEFENILTDYIHSIGKSLKIVKNNNLFRSDFFTSNKEGLYLKDDITRKDLSNFFRDECSIIIILLLKKLKENISCQQLLKKIQIIVPCFNEEENILPLYKSVKNIIKELNYKYKIEFLFIDDGSIDKSLDIIREIQLTDDIVHYIKLSRNFGKEAAMMAGVESSKDYDAVIFLDADGQDSPELITQMISQFELGYDDIYGKRISRNDKPFYKNYLAKYFYKILHKTTPFDIPENVGDFRLINKKCIDAICELKEKNRYTKGLFAYIGFKKKILYFNRPERALGKSKCGIYKQLGLAMTGLINFSSLFTIVPFILSIIFFCLSIFILLFNIDLLTENSINSIKLWITFISLDIVGIVLLSLSLIIKLQNNLLNEAKNRPIYYIEDKI